MRTMEIGHRQYLRHSVLNISADNQSPSLIKKSRDATNQSKQSVDSFNLQLQNVLYEVLHLKKEVTKCVHFKVGFKS